MGLYSGVGYAQGGLILRSGLILMDGIYSGMGYAQGGLILRSGLILMDSAGQYFNNIVIL